MAAAHRANETAERFSVVYSVHGKDEADARERTTALCLEQTVELPAKLVQDDPFLWNEVVGQLEHFQADPQRANVWLATVSYHVDTTGFEFPQFLNVVFGNSSIKEGLVVEEILPCASLAKAFPGPRFGTAGLRKLVGVPTGALIQTALKPQGSSTAALAEMAYQLALGGIDVIKDDHGLANQTWSPFEERVTACCAAVAKANQETGKKVIYAPCICAPAHLVHARAMFAKKAGAGAVLMIPGITGFDSMVQLAKDDEFALPIIAHPALLGSHVRAGFSHQVLFGTLCRLAGADASIFPNYGGRFGFSQEECLAIERGCSAPLLGMASISPTPGGGMSMEKIPQMLEVYGSDVMLLIGGDLIGRSPCLKTNAQDFLKVMGR